MAKYTMTLAEYLVKGGALPSSFSLIEGFEDLFVAKYCDHEIGFETDDLFSIKLDLKASLIMQTYKERIDARAIYWLKVPNPTKVHYEHATTYYNMGAQKVKTTELPFDSATAAPNIINENDAYQNADIRDNRHEDNGESVDEVMKMLDFLNKDVTTLVEKCLNEFSQLFMQVY